MKHEAQPQPPAATPAIAKAERVLQPVGERNVDVELKDQGVPAMVHVFQACWAVRNPVGTLL